MTGVLIKRGKTGTETQTEGKHYVKMKAESGVIIYKSSNDKYCQQTTRS